MKILLVHNYYRFRGGEEVYLDSLAQLLKKNGHKVRLFAKDNQTINSFSFLDKVKTALRMFWNKGVYTEFSGVLQRFKPDIVHFNNIFPLVTPTAYYACRRYKVPIVQTIHNFRYMFPKSILMRRGKYCPVCLNKSRFYPWFLHRCYGEAITYTIAFSLSHAFHLHLGSFFLVNAFIFPSLFAKSYYSKNTALAYQRFHLLPNAPSLKRSAGLAKKKSDFFLFVGRLSQEKGIIELLEVFRRNLYLKLVVVGDGPLKREVGVYKKYKNIKILGHRTRDQVFVLMKKALVTVIPSKWQEVMPTVLSESFAAGTGVIVPGFGVFRDLVKDGETGLFYKSGSPRDMEEVIRKVARDRNLALKMAKYANVEYKKYTQKDFYKGLLSLYQSLAE